MKPRALSIAIFAALAAAVLLALCGAARRSAAGDEFGSIWLASQASPAFIVSKVMSSDVHPATPYLLLHAWGRLFGYGDRAMRLLSLVFVLLSLGVVWRLLPQLVPGLSEDQRGLAFLLSCVAPVLWVQASTARYYALCTFAGLLAISCYLAWHERPVRSRWVGYVLATAATFYLHYLLAALVMASQGLHYAAAKPRRAGRSWIAAQVLIVALAVPIVLSSAIPLLTGVNPMLSNRAAEGVAGLQAIPLVLAGHLFSTFTGGLPFPWHVWVTLPWALALAGLAVADLRGSRLLLGRTIQTLVILPFLLLAVAIALVLPVAGYFQGVVRVGHIPVLAWVTLGLLVATQQRTAVRRLLAGIVLACGAYGLVVHGLDLFSMNQSVPLRSVAGRLAGDPHAIVFHPFTHGWGDPLRRYAGDLPMFPIGDEIAAERVAEYADLVARERPATVWVIRRNRFSERADELAGWLSAHRYQAVESTPLQPQGAYDIWFKERLKSIRALGFKSSASHPSYWTMTRFERLASP